MAVQSSEFCFSSVIRGYHVYKSTWQPFTGEQLQIEREAGNPSNRFAVAVIFGCAPEAEHEW